MFSKVALFGQFLKGFNFLSAFAGLERRAEPSSADCNQQAYAYHGGLTGHRCKAGLELRQ
jgi:hypothetical protein